jgi:hypothetical protein
MASLALAAPARASDVDCTVPFSFVVSSKTLPPGTYHVSIEAQQGKMMVRGLAQGVFVLTSRVDVSDRAHAKLVFHKYGDEYVLREVWTGDGVENDLPAPRHEKELAKSARNGGAAGAPERVVVSAE